MNKNIRFKIFQRDNFTCQYCGRRTPEVVLEVDHIIAGSKGGSDDVENLITSCFDCNRGKGASDLKDTPKRIQKNIEEIKERTKQLKAFYKYQAEIERKNASIMAELTYYWSELWDQEYSLNIRGEAGVKRFLKMFSKEEIKEAMAISREKIPSDVQRAFHYFCGILWTKIRNRKGEQKI